ncbi:MAG: DNA-directed RNA polymerase subunit alpha [Patescibacteria group bacterium]|nr:DNA-directed RNA polymerase subunit alpha [Patescibacteria group bacterium]MCL5095546.1 DNA-directed RNA polymerase subunit alpha [Patescibacteria group bacterium]
MFEPNFKIKAQEERDDYGKFIIEPLDQGFGHTLGNALRRILLSSLPGAAVTTIKIEGVKHQFSTIPGLSEDVVEFILNVKKIRFKLSKNELVKVTLSARGPGKITAGDLKLTSGLEVANKDLYLGTLADSKSKIEAEMTVEPGFGFLPAEEQKTGAVGIIPLDATFSPVLRVNYKVEATRVGRMTNLDKLILEVWTDKTIDPLSAVRSTAKILVSYFLQIYEPKAVPTEGVAVTPAVSDEILKMTIEELDLPTRISNAFKNGGIETVGQLLGTPKKELMKIKNLGGKSITTVEEKLREKGVALSV